MKKEYMKPEMLVHQISPRSMLLGSKKGVYGKISGIEQAEMVYGGYVDEELEEQFDPD